MSFFIRNGASIPAETIVLNILIFRDIMIKLIILPFMNCKLELYNIHQSLALCNFSMLRRCLISTNFHCASLGFRCWIVLGSSLLFFSCFLTDSTTFVSICTMPSKLVDSSSTWNWTQLLLAFYLDWKASCALPLSKMLIQAKA